MDKLHESMERLHDHYGVPAQQDRSDPIRSLIKVLLSHNTTDQNRDRAYTALWSRYDSAREIMEAPQDELADTINVAGLHNVKAERIQQTLTKIVELRGELNLDFIHDMGLDEAKDWLKQLPGVGPKSAAVVLNFTFGKSAMPVDTHVNRVSKRIGLIPEDMGLDEAHDVLEDMTPDDRIYEFHVNLITHGREICKAPTPICSDCFLNDICDFYQEHRDDAEKWK
jgi:endonuclease-3